MRFQATRQEHPGPQLSDSRLPELGEASRVQLGDGISARSTEHERSKQAGLAWARRDPRLGRWSQRCLRRDSAAHNRPHSTPGLGKLSDLPRKQILSSCHRALALS